MSYLVPMAVIDQSINGLFFYDIESDWNDERIEEYLREQGRHPSNCSWGVFDGEIVDLRGEYVPLVKHIQNKLEDAIGPVFQQVLDEHKCSGDITPEQKQYLDASTNSIATIIRDMVKTNKL